MPFLLRFYLVAASLLLGACSALYDELGPTVQAAFGNSDIELPLQQIRELPYPSLYARIDDGPQAFWVLGYIENDQQQQWLSADSNLLVTQHGRIIKTALFQRPSLVATHSQQADPLATGQLLDSPGPHQWRWQMDLMPNYRFGVEAQSQFYDQGPVTVETPLGSANCRYFIEKVTIPALDLSYSNHYWLDINSRRMVKSQQTPGPGLPPVAITHLKQYAP
jgi:hypothetical protein